MSRRTCPLPPSQVMLKKSLHYAYGTIEYHSASNSDSYYAMLSHVLKMITEQKLKYDMHF